MSKNGTGDISPHYCRICGREGCYGDEISGGCSFPRVVKMKENQEWYWTEEWQKAEKIADENYSTGNYNEMIINDLLD